MRKTLTIFIATAFGATSMVFGQLHRNCSTMHVHDRLSKEDPSYIENLKHVEEHTSQYVLNPTTSNKTNAVITIPVVVHVVYNTTTQNISDAQIQSQIDVLNEDFRKLNADRTLIPTDFSSVAADAEIQFCLAKRDPNGLSTTGIVRKSTTVTSFSSDDKVKSSTTGGSNAWPSSSYLNLWVCNLGGGLLGYAQFPGGPASTDGVVIGYTCFGRTGTAQAPFNKGRTGTHEVGHWLNLRHIWGDAACGSDLNLNHLNGFLCLGINYHYTWCVVAYFESDKCCRAVF